MYNFLKDKTVLYVEDELEVLRNISSLLNNFFAKVYLASDGETALQLFLEQRIDVLLIDIELPKMNGIELIKEIRKTNKHIPIVIISAYTNKSYLLDAVELNLSKYIVKPLTSSKIQTLLTILNEYFTDNDEILIAQGISVFQKESVLCVEGNRVKLTQKELNFLISLAKKKAITYEEIYGLWKGDTPTLNAIRTFIKQLRRKLPQETIKTANDLGYYLDGFERL